MIIESIELQNYRNYENLKLSFGEKNNIFYGDNAQGKTNLLEAIFFAGSTKSFRFCKDRDVIRFSEEEAHIKMILKKKDMRNRIDIHLKRNKSKGIAINGFPVKKASDLFGLLNIVIFSPEDLSLIKDGPKERRRFIDLELCQLNKIYLYNLTRYNRVLLQRNKLLKEIAFQAKLEESLSVWDEELIQYGKEIIRLRREFIHSLQEKLSRIHKNISGGKEELELLYEENVKEDDFMDVLLKSRESEKKQRISLVGPHRDDLLFRINGEDIRKYGSQGQKRTAALSLKLAEIEEVKEEIKDYPVLLLDDVFSELDRKRQNYLLEEIKEVQSMITCTGLEDLVENRFPIDKLYFVENGRITGK